MRNDALALFPGALGDFICFLPTLAALRRRHPDGVTVVAKPEWLTLVDLPRDALISIDRSEIADLFTDSAPVRNSTRTLLGHRSHAYSWTGAADRVFGERLAAISSGSVGVFAFRGMRPGEHAADYYARCAGVEPAPFTSLLRIDHEWFSRFSKQYGVDGRTSLVIHAGSGSPAKNWTGFAELAERWQARHGARSRVLWLTGPAESESTTLAQPDGVVPVRDVTLPQAAALLKHCELYAGNDSGISHLAAAAGARGVVLFGSTEPATWAPRGGSVRIIHAPEECAGCGPRRFCTHRLSVEAVENALKP